MIIPKKINIIKAMGNKPTIPKPISEDLEGSQDIFM